MQRPYPREAVVHQQLCGLSRGHFVRAGAVEDDVAVARQILDVLSNRAERNVPRPGNASRLERSRRVRAHIDNHRNGSRIHEPVELIDVDSRHAQHREEAMPFPPFVGEVGDAKRDKSRDRQGARPLEQRQQIHDLLLENQSGAQPGPNPEARAQRAEDQEADPADAGRARERRRDGRQARNEIRDQKRIDPPALEQRLRLAYAGVRRERHPAERLHDAVAEMPADEVPGDVGYKRRGDRDAEQFGRGQLAVRCERAGDHQQGDRGRRKTQLVQQHVREYQRQPVLRDQLAEVLHSARG